MHHPKIAVVLLLSLLCGMQQVYSQSSTTEIPPSASTASDSPGTSDSTTAEPSTAEPSTEEPQQVFTCTNHKGFAIDLEAISGYWYEVARVPDIDSTQCLNYSIPSAPKDDGKIDIKLEYVDAADGKWEPEQDSADFPWDENAKNGIFSWTIGDTTKMDVTFKMIDTDNTTYAFLCGYMGIAPVPLFKILTRQRELSAEQKTSVQQRFNDFGQTSTLIWVEQSEQKCNSAMRATGGTLLALVVALLLRY